MLFEAILVAIIIIFLVVVYKILTRKEEIEEKVEENEETSVVPYEESLPSFPQIKKEIIKEEIYPISHAEEWFHEGVKNQNIGNYDDAISNYSRALEIFNQKEYPPIFAAIKNNIGTIYRRLASIENSKSYLYKAVKVYKEALIVYANLGYKTELAMIQNNLGVVYHQLANMTNKEKFFYDAIKSFKEALKAYDIGDYPLEYTSIQNNMGNVYRDLSKLTDEKKNLVNAASAYKEALKIFKIISKISGRDSLPVECASIQQNLGEVYSQIAKIEKNREDAISMAIESFYKKKIHKKEYSSQVY